MAGILPSTPEAARAEIERLLANVPGLDLSIHQELLASDGLSQIVHMTNGNWTEVRVHGRLNGFPASAFLLALEDEELGRHLLMRAVEAVAEQARTPGERRVDALVEAAERGDEDQVRFLLMSEVDEAGEYPGVPPDAASRLYGGTPLSCACCLGHTGVVQLLLDYGASVTLRPPPRGPLFGSWLPLMIATQHVPEIAAAIWFEGPQGPWAQRDPLDIVRLLLAAGASPEAVEDDVEGSVLEGVTPASPLAYAAALVDRPRPDDPRDGQWPMPMEVLRLFKQTRRSRLWARLRRIAPRVGWWRRALMRLFEDGIEVHYRPGHEGARRCQLEFEDAAAIVR